MTKGRGNIALPSRRLATNCRPPQYSMPANMPSVVFSAHSFSCGGTSGTCMGMVQRCKAAKVEHEAQARGEHPHRLPRLDPHDGKVQRIRHSLPWGELFALPALLRLMLPAGRGGSIQLFCVITHAPL